jgi:predicted Zn-dependent protease
MPATETESTDLDRVAARFRSVAPAADFWSLRVVDERNEQLAVRRGVVQPPHVSYDSGAMITVWHRGGVGYAATSDLTAAGLRGAAARALEWARLTAGCRCATVSIARRCRPRGRARRRPRRSTCCAARRSG